MSYCINPHCRGDRQNPESLDQCQSCGTSLIVTGSRRRSYRLIQPLRDSYHPYAEVFSATDLRNHHETKVLKTLINDSPKLVELFEQEGELLESLIHHGIPHYEDQFEFVVSEPQRQIIHCLVMERIEGVNLESWVEKNGRIDEETALNWLEQLALILGYVHERGFFHRDIKPSNIMRRSAARQGEELVLIDFGTARELTDTVINGRQVTAVYSTGYTAPEQIEGRAVPQSDFYALGRTFVYLLTGQNPHHSRLDLNNWKWATRCPRSGLISCVNRLMATNPADRPQSVDEMLQELDAVRRGGTYSPPQSNPPHSPASPAVPPEALGDRTETLYPPPEPPPLQPPVGPSPSRKVPTRILGLGGVGVAALAALLVPAWRCQIFPAAICAEPTPSRTAASSLALAAPFLELSKQGESQLSGGEFEQAFETFEAIRNEAAQQQQSLSSGAQRDEAIAVLRNPVLLIQLNNAKARWQHEQGEPIYTIAAAVPLNVERGVEILRGVALMQQKALADGINLEVLIENDRNDPEQAKQVAEQLVNNADVLAVIGHYTSSSTCEALKVYSPKRLVVVSSTSTVTNLRSACGDDTNRVFFRTVSTAKVEAETLHKQLDRLVNGPTPNVAVFYNAAEMFSKDLFDQFKAIADAEGVELTPFDLSKDLDVRKSVAEVEDADVLAIFPDGQTGNPDAFNRAVAVLEENRGRKPVLGANTLYSQEVLNQVSKAVGGEALVGQLFIAVEWHEQCSASTFDEDVKNTYASGGVNRLTALSYEAVQSVLAAIERSAAQPELRPEDIQAALLNDEPVPSGVVQNGTISFDSDGNREEYTARLLTTVEQVGDTPKFVLLPGEACLL